MNNTTIRTEKDAKLVADLEFKDFDEAFDMMTRIAELCKEHGHHPTWTNTYNKLHIELSTHDAGDTVTQKDRDLADAIEKVI